LEIIESFYSQGYTAFWGIDGIAEYESTLDTFDVNRGDRIPAMLESSNMLFQSSKYSKDSSEDVANEPDLDEMTQSAIDFLSKDDDGFIIMIEEALIDKASHNQDVATAAQEMHMMQKTLGTVFDFYSNHPDDTLIIFTADHECGYYTYKEEGYEGMLALPAIDWHTDYEDLYLMLADECRTYVDESRLKKLMQAGDMDLWGDDDKDYGVVHALIAEALCKRYGLYSRNGEHLGPPVPCYIQGLKSEAFSKVEHISEIPMLICDIMEWEALPEIIDQDNSIHKNG
jgi:alkaline phosphatase